MAEIYRALAEVFYLAPGEHLPDWFALPGKDWPLLQNVLSLSMERPSSQLKKAVDALDRVPGQTLSSRESEYEALFVGHKQPPIWLYGSYYLDGRVPGPTTFTISKLYSRVGLAVDGAELADHASIELAFLAFLVEKEIEDEAYAREWRSVQRTFLSLHFKKWFPNVIRGISSSNFLAWKAIGYVCDAALLHEKGARKLSIAGLNMPALKKEADCTLCGFCFRVCPTQALSIRDSDTTTVLGLMPEKCTGCQKCVKVCPEGVLLLGGDTGGTEEVLLKESPRSRCPVCRTPTISEAELTHVALKLGNPEWLRYCMECRTKFPMSS